MKKLMSLALALVIIISLFSAVDLTAFAETTDDGFVYSVYNNTVSISGYTGNEKNVVFPSEINGMSVTSIGDYVFGYDGSDNVEGITIPSSVTSVSYNAFDDCHEIASIIVDSGNTVYDSRNNCNAIIVTDENSLMKGCMNTVIPDSVTEIWGGAFMYSTHLTSIYIPESVEYFSGNPFMCCTSLEQISVSPDNPYLDSRENCNAVIETATDELLSGCKNTIIPASVKNIGFNAFNGCTGLKTLNIPAGCNKEFGAWALDGCTGLESITVDENNTTYDSRNNCNAIILTASNTLIRACKNTVIPDDVVTIGSGAFDYCIDIESITIPKSVTYIGSAFNGCSQLTDVYYAGTKAEWEAIVIENYAGGNDPLLEANIHYAPCDKHTPGEKTITKPATCTENGVATTICAVCGESYTEEIPAAGHKTVIDNAVPATFTSTGKTEGSHCSVCGEVFVKQNDVAKLGAPVIKLKKGKKSFTAQWNKVNGVDGYHVQYGLKKNFKGAKTKWAKANAQKLNIKKLKAKKKYYVRIRAYKKIGGKTYYSAWSVKNVKTK